MASVETGIDTGISLMKMALVHLDAAEEWLAGARLQHAIDTAEKTPIASSADDKDELVARFKILMGEG